MKAYMYRAALYCEPCGERLRARLIEDQNPHVPADPADEHTYDSDDFPKGPYSYESDAPQHCGYYDRFLQNPLTEEGVDYVCQELVDGEGRADVLLQWLDFYGPDLTAFVRAGLEERLGRAIRAAESAIDAGRAVKS